MSEQIVKQLREAGDRLPLVGDTGTNLHLDAAAEIQRLQVEVERLRGVTPELPPYPPGGEGLPRYGLRWNGPDQPLTVPMDDGYWTPWHLAAAVQQERDQLKAQLSEEERGHVVTINQRDNAENHADRLAEGIAKVLGIDIGEHSSMNCPWHNAFFAIEEFDLAGHDAAVIERFRAQLRGALFPHGRTRACYSIGDFDYVWCQASQQAQEVQS